jgi:hypothetical protein
MIGHTLPDKKAARMADTTRDTRLNRGFAGPLEPVDD